MDKFTIFLFDCKEAFRYLFRNNPMTPSERRYLTEGEEKRNAIKQSKGQLIFPGWPKKYRKKVMKKLLMARQEQNKYIPPTDIYYIITQQITAYIISNMNPYINRDIQEERVFKGIFYFLTITYFEYMCIDDRDGDYLFNAIKIQFDKLRRMGYWRYLKEAKKVYPNMFVSKTRFRCVKKVKGERRCDTARKERTSYKIEIVALYILQNLKKRKNTRRFMSPNGCFKSKFLQNLKEHVEKKFSGKIGMRMLRTYISKALEFLGITREQIVEEGARYNIEREDTQMFVIKLARKYKKRLHTVIGYIADMIFPQCDLDMICTLRI